MKAQFIIAGKYENEETKLHLERDCGQKCRFGFNWWVWLPKFRVTKYHNDFSWFCFMISFLKNR